MATISRKKYNVKLSSSPAELRARFYAMRSKEDVAGLLEVLYKDLVYWIYRVPENKRYTIFEIPKKNGERRQIAAPNVSNKILQQKLNQVLLAVYTPRPSCHGFALGRSVKTNAQEHVKRKLIFNVDLVNFFPQINFGRVRGMFMARPYNLPADVATILAHICCFNRALPQGAPTSPVISNMICRKMDSELQRLAGLTGCWYSRYADDLSFSTSRQSFPNEIAVKSFDEKWIPGEALEAVIKGNGFEINLKKVRLRSKGQRQEVTGVIVNEFPNVICLGTPLRYLK